MQDASILLQAWLHPQVEVTVARLQPVGLAHRVRRHHRGKEGTVAPNIINITGRTINSSRVLKTVDTMVVVDIRRVVPRGRSSKAIIGFSTWGTARPWIKSQSL